MTSINEVYILASMLFDPYPAVCRTHTDASSLLLYAREDAIV